MTQVSVDSGAGSTASPPPDAGAPATEAGEPAGRRFWPAIRRRTAALPGGLWRAIATNKLFMLLFAAGAVGRGFAIEAYRPLLSNLDSFWYVQNSIWLVPQGVNPMGYSLLIRLFSLFANEFALGIFQHALGLGMGLGCYVFLRRFGAPRILAALACAPILLDAYEWQMEEYLLSDSVFLAMITGGTLLLAWRGRAGWKAAFAAGLILGLSCTVRSIGEVTFLPAALYLLWAAGPGWRQRLGRTAALLVAFAMPLLAYAGDMEANVGTFTITTSSDTSAAMLYGRAATYANCAAMPAKYKYICPTGTVAQREATGPDFYDDNPGSPISTYRLPQGPAATALERGFAYYVFEHQPVQTVQVVGKDFLALFLHSRSDVTGATPISRWQFFTTYPVWATDRNPWALFSMTGDDSPNANQAVAQGLLDYQLDGGYTPGYLFSFTLLAGLAGAVGVTRRARRSPVRPAAFLFIATGLALLLGSDLYEFTWRYELPAVVFLPVGGALGLMALFGWDGKKRTAAGGMPRLEAYPDEVDLQVAAEFEKRGGFGDRQPEVVVLLAAYNEEEAIGAVLDEIPDQLLGMTAVPLVVVDGNTDATAQIAKDRGVPTMVVEANRGQGAALRIGYNAAYAAGAQYIVTTDGDGQYDGTRLDEVLKPVVSGEADFVVGSRVLGRSESKDWYRSLGVRVFSAIISVLMRTRVTDSSSGLRAMRAAIPVGVRLEQPQYQTSEMMISVLAAGYRVSEVPMVMLKRSAGDTKKGKNFIYGCRYARVVFGTWLRERGPGSRRVKTSLSNNTNLTTNTTP
ncbi:MAG TPA: glycosyltransferase [Actinocrinis sp.]